MVGLLVIVYMSYVVLPQLSQSKNQDAHPKWQLFPLGCSLVHVLGRKRAGTH